MMLSRSDRSSFSIWLWTIDKWIFFRFFTLLLLGIIFGPEAPFVGDVYKNISDLLNLIGSDGLLGLVAIIIILAYLKK